MLIFMRNSAVLRFPFTSLRGNGYGVLISGKVSARLRMAASAPPCGGLSFANVGLALKF